uniref:Uncharacterized protein n=1 Tax=Strongyloides papillosus TaxID=174720 RepID=A0A0N5CIN1_STREA
MVFFKALTVFIVCISIFRDIISKSTLCKYGKTMKECNVLLTGYIECSLCKNKKNRHVKIYLDERYLVEWIDADCNQLFFIPKYLEEPHKEDYKASFYLLCNSETEKVVANKTPKYMEHLKTVKTYVYMFETIDLTTTKERNNRKRRNGLKKYNF